MMHTKEVHPNVLKCTNDGEHMNEEFLTAIRKHIEDTETKRLKCAPISLLLTDLTFHSSHFWKIKFEDVRHDRVYVVSHEYSEFNKKYSIPGYFTSSVVPVTFNFNSVTKSFPGSILPKVTVI